MGDVTKIQGAVLVGLECQQWRQRETTGLGLACVSRGGGLSNGLTVGGARKLGIKEGNFVPAVTVCKSLFHLQRCLRHGGCYKVNKTRCNPCLQAHLKSGEKHD